VFGVETSARCAFRNVNPGCAKRSKAVLEKTPEESDGSILDRPERGVLTFQGGFKSVVFTPDYTSTQ